MGSVRDGEGMEEERMTGAARTMARAVVTGATGAIGIALLEELIGSGVEVLALCRPGSARNARIPDHPLVTVRECPLEGMASLEKEEGRPYDVFYHLAWAGTTGADREDMEEQAKNIGYALDAVALGARLGCRLFVGAGSQAEYGRVEGVLQPDTPAFPETGYGMGKLCAGLMTRSRAHQLGMEHIWVRVLSVYGPGDTEGSMVMSTIRKLRAGQIPSFTKGEQMWDYLYSRDAARALCLMGTKGVDGRTYVLGSGHARPLQDYIKELRDVAAPQGRLAIGALPYAKKQVMYLCADISSLRQDTGWQPQTSFADGIREIVEKL